MDQAPAAPARHRSPRFGDGELFAALDLGTNNCRLLVATPAGRGFRIVDSYSRIVRLGEGLTQNGRLSDGAMERAMSALGVCADKIRRRGASHVRAVATQACRTAANGAQFLGEVEARTGLRLSVISPREEARLAVAGCLDLIDDTAKAVLILDVGGGSTELSWLDLRAGDLERHPGRRAYWRPPIAAWLSIPVGVVSLTERFPHGEADNLAGFRAMVEAVKAELGRYLGADTLRQVFTDGQTHLIGTSGAITSLAGLHLGLARYDRSRVDGLWMTRDACEAVARRLAGLTVAERGAQPCIGPDRADLVLAGASILQAVQEVWPCQRVRVADRGLREGLLLSLMAQRRRDGRRPARWPEGAET
jgi:exopolyphosphatase/guanosine-5'-triphosphate,3'-diphosphate pyrophosphatase